MNETVAHDVRHEGAHRKELYFPWFDWLRAACACVVMWHHGRIFAWAQTGNFGVQVFFALSGWLIGGILLKTSANQLPRFYFNRAVRIWVPYYLAGVLLLTLSVMREPVTAKWMEFVIYKLTFVYNLFGVPQLAQFHDAMPQKGTLNHFWSVNVEEQFYLVAPLFLVLLSRRFGRSPWLWAVLAAVGLMHDLGAIMLGVFAATVVNRHGPIHQHPKARWGMLAALVVCVGLLAIDLDYDHVSPFAGVFIVLLLAVPGKRTTVGTIFGGMSYPLYLNHWIGLYATNALLARFWHHDAPLLVMAFLEAAINIPVAIALYWLVDRRLLKKREGWYSNRRGRIVTAVAYGLIAVGLMYGFAMQAKARRDAPVAVSATPG